MATSQLHEIATALAAVISAIGGCAAALAAFRSASSARLAAKAADDSAHRATLREISSLATSVDLEIVIARSVAGELIAECGTADALSGSAGNTGIEEMRSGAKALAEKASGFAQNARPFTGGAKPLLLAPPAEVDRVLVRLADDLVRISANVTGDFGSVTDSEPMLCCAGQIV